MALHLPDHFSQAVHDVMLRVHGVAIPLEQTLIAFADAGRLVDRHLLGDRQVHGKVQERVGLAGFRQVVTLPVTIGLVEQGVVFGMRQHGIERRLFRPRQRLAGAEPIGFQLPKVDFAAMAMAMGIPGHVVHSSHDLDALDFDALLARPGPTLLDVRIDGEEVPPMNLRMKTLGTAR